MFDCFSEEFVDLGETEVEFFVVLGNRAESVEVKEYFEQITEKFSYSEIKNGAVPLADSFIEDSHDSQEIMWLLLVVNHAE